MMKASRAQYQMLQTQFDMLEEGITVAQSREIARVLQKYRALTEVFEGFFWLLTREAGYLESLEVL
ncbi:hypothetical protein [Comamonas resistens]|uniref:Uncharacterized protein n=1 Tax=Comamonas resistens TaxID=3046670 RepID=A0ABY8SXN6_9BURK|nr:hypothetical protein [Comamonas resistens]MDL5039034.1 hypothetical protein [Comamonas resistens]WHS67515.1 hypothetical protein QMY55_10570 [Comamonas resistens]